MIPNEQTNLQEPYESVSCLLARGYSSHEIIQRLQQQHPDMAPDDVAKLLKLVYSNWQHSADILDLSQDDIRNWHLQLRHILLQKAMTGLQFSTALSILESLAKLQNVATMSEVASMPMIINLVPKVENETKDAIEPEPETPSIDQSI